MPPPTVRTVPHPTCEVPPAQYTSPATQPVHEEGGFTTVSRTGKGKKGRGKTNEVGPVPEQVQLIHPTPTSYAGAAAAASNVQQPQPQTLRTGGNPTPAITEVTVIRSGGLLDLVLFQLGLAQMPRLWLGPSRLWLSQTSGRALAIKDSLALARLGWGHGL